jgi:hypothetical protein
MPVNDRFRTRQIQGDDDSQSLARPGGASSKASTTIAPDGGSRLSGMRSLLLKGLDPDVKKLAGGGSGRQFYTKASGGDLGKGKPKLGSVKKVKTVTL